MHVSYIYTPLYQCRSTTGWRRLIGSPNLQIVFHKRATRYRSLLRKMTYQDKGSYESSPPCILNPNPWILIYVSWFWILIRVSYMYMAAYIYGMCTSDMSGNTFMFRMYASGNTFMFPIYAWHCTSVAETVWFLILVSYNYMTTYIYWVWTSDMSGNIFIFVMYMWYPTRGGGLGSSTIFKNLMSPTPRRKWYLTTGRRAH